MQRRTFLTAVVAASLTTLAACATPPSAKPAKVALPKVGSPELPSTVVPASLQVPKAMMPNRPITGLPIEGPYLAWTVDDGADLNAINSYIDFAEETGNRITFFMLGSYGMWAQAAPRMLPLVQSGQIQIANHTYSHLDLTKSSDVQIQADLLKCEQVIHDLFGVQPQPWYRPPYGNRNARTDAAAAAVGYTVPVMWFGTLGDAAKRTPDEVIGLAGQYFQPGRIVIGHANYSGGVTEAFPRLNQILTERQLTTVTLNDVFTA